MPYSKVGRRQAMQRLIN